MFAHLVNVCVSLSLTCVGACLYVCTLVCVLSCLTKGKMILSKQPSYECRHGFCWHSVWAGCVRFVPLAWIWSSRSGWESRLLHGSGKCSEDTDLLSQPHFKQTCSVLHIYFIRRILCFAHNNTGNILDWLSYLKCHWVMGWYDPTSYDTFLWLTYKEMWYHVYFISLSVLKGFNQYEEIHHFWLKKPWGIKWQVYLTNPNWPPTKDKYFQDQLVNGVKPSAHTHCYCAKQIKQWYFP